MNILIIAFILILWLILGYKVYGSFIEKKVLKIDKSRVTPAQEFCDGVDYSPAKKPLLFGHHFSSIAGAGPILGPLLGVLYFGWLGALLWVALGSVFLGAVHDYTSLMTSVQNKGTSLGDISEKTLGKRTKVIFSVFLWFALALVIAVFAVVASRSLVSQPEIVIPTFGLVFLAMIIGWLIYKKGLPIALATLIALAILFLLIYLGELIPVELPARVIGMSSQNFWFFVLIIYSLFASSLPVWFLLQPRDYISTWILFLGLGIGYLGLIVLHPPINAPVFVSFSSEGGGPLWPMLFVIIACGAISGFHSIVAGGTTSKQLPNEASGKLIGYGGMVTEAALAGLVIFIAAGALVWEPSGLKSQFGFQYLMNTVGDPITAFATGYGRMVSSLPGLTLTLGSFFGMVMLNAFVLTTLDTGTRLGRFIFSEMTGKIALFKNRWVASTIILVFAGLLGATEGYKAIWPVFGASNQLVAALALIVVSSYLVAIKRPKTYTLYPAYFMLVTTLAALLYQGFNFFKDGSYLLAAVSALLIILALFIVYEARSLLFNLKTDQPKPSKARKLKDQSD